MELFPRAWSALQEAVRSLEAPQWVAPSGCAGWLVQDLVFHLIIGAQDILITLVTTTGAPATRDAVSYWQPGAPGDGTDAESAFIRRGAGAYSGPAALTHHFGDLAVSAGKAAAAADPTARVETRDQVLTVADYLTIYVVESTLHHLDLTLHLSGVDEPPPETLAATRGIVERVAGRPAPAADDREALLFATGRLPAPAGFEPVALG
ncbi:maleylpyruvate isomerase N-terminal domain-containing protein [Amycolatopsis sp. FDAARGOS 1241]|uniref:maleylpyruvate isomerase N-terminal domain-containing protein n=1 Tax=Amycolatopsis sp. FDAARGOS 1241 TaxID=2778070 RepID=UPI00195022BB|nr:maleylpyruvate isomerase N-terminal domain-containing protein [Amycolatopsis sp. FDAARGOS 1241]QRP43880.1 maleylpyruvate isomerase N-terminal domain-containing protein [Amycolatopsis sp. FDAARGOS 1241]